jgi:GDPmannose 4,6-dehydratase
VTKKALITGITGQDGFYLTRLLISKGYQVYGWSRELSHERTSRFIKRIQSEFGESDNLKLLEVDPLNFVEVRRSIEAIQPNEIYNLGSQSNIGKSFEEPQSTFTANTSSVLNLLEAVRQVDARFKIRFFQASSASVFEGSQQSPQNEETLLTPRSPYAASKASSQLLVSSYRQAYDLFACSGILYNHESPLRPESFVTGKIVKAVASIALGHDESLVLGNLETGRDWGYAGDYVGAMWRMLQRNQPDDFIIATGIWHSLKEFLEIAFRTVGLDWQDYTSSDPKFFRPTEPIQLVGDITKIELELKWTPTTSFQEMIEVMVKQKILDMRKVNS